MKIAFGPVGMVQRISKVVVLAVAVVVAAVGEVRAQGGPDILYDTSFSLTAPAGFAATCALAMDPVGPHNSFVFRDYTNRGSGYGFYFTTVSPLGGVHTHYSGPVSFPQNLRTPYPVRVSRDGRNVAYINLYPSSAVQLRFSQDYGATFTNIPLTVIAPYGNPKFPPNRKVINNMVFGSDGNLYVFYITSRIPATGQPWDAYRLELLTVTPNGVASHRSLATLSGTYSGLNIMLPSYEFFDVIATSTKVVAVVSVGPTYQANSSAPTYSDVPAAFVLDVGTQVVETISFGATPGGPNMTNPIGPSMPAAAGETMLASDGQSIFMVNYGLPDPITNKPTYMIREFTDAPGKTARFFINTAAPGDQPYMDLEAPALQFGTPLSIGDGIIYQIVAKWPVMTPRDHAVDVYGYAEWQLQQTGVDALDVQRARIVNPNSGAAPIFVELLNDFGIGALAQGGITSSILDGPELLLGFGQRYSTNSASDAVTTTFCQFAGTSNWNYTFFVNDIS